MVDSGHCTSKTSQQCKQNQIYCPKNKYKINFLGQDVSMMPSSYLLLYILPAKNIYVTVTTSAFLFMIFAAIRNKQHLPYSIHVIQLTSASLDILHTFLHHFSLNKD